MPEVLIADDSRFQRQMLASLLLPNKFEVGFAVDALQTFLVALRSTPDLILLDINMPGGTGIEVPRRLRVSNKTQPIPVIVVSGGEKPTTEAMARELGAVDLSTSPSTSNSSATPSIACSASRPTHRSSTAIVSSAPCLWKCAISSS